MYETDSFDDGSTPDITSAATWASSNTAVATIDGSVLAIGVSVGTTDITASQDGVTSNIASLQVTAVTCATTVSVVSITYATEGGKNGNRHLLIFLTLKDNLGNAVSGASVSIRLDNATTGVFWTGTNATATDGTTGFRLKNAPAGDYVTTVTEVTADSLTWDNVTPANRYTKTSGISKGSNKGTLQ